jgi:S1-C subfamily serine protease
MVLRTFFSLPTLVAINALAGFAQTTTVSTEAVAKASKSVVLLKGVTETGTVLGSGFILSSDGKIATNLHVIRGMKSGGVQPRIGRNLR